jgi:putative phosphoesterase
MRLIGVISDTHGLLRPEAVTALQGVELIIHAGDIGSAQVLEELRAIAPVVAVRGNNDHEGWAKALADIEIIDVNGEKLCVLHDVKQLAMDAQLERIGVVIAGHSHHPQIEHRGKVLFLNPGSAGPKRFKLPTTVAKLHVATRPFHAEIVHLDV